MKTARLRVQPTGHGSRVRVIVRRAPECPEGNPEHHQRKHHGKHIVLYPRGQPDADGREQHTAAGHQGRRLVPDNAVPQTNHRPDPGREPDRHQPDGRGLMQLEPDHEDQQRYGENAAVGTGQRQDEADQ